MRVSLTGSRFAFLVFRPDGLTLRAGAKREPVRAKH